MKLPYRSRHISVILSFLILFLYSGNAFSTNYSSDTALGDWTDPASWTPVGVPTCGDVVTILAGHEIQVTTVLDYSGCGSPIFLEIHGTLHFPNSGGKLKLPSGSGIEVHGTGEIKKSGPGGGNSRTIEIGPAVVWDASTGTISGLFLFGSPLPVTLESFEAVFNEDQVEFYWATASEQNSDYFVVERSKNGEIWDEVVWVDAAENSSSRIEYYDYDSEPLYGKSYYRLVQYDLNGDFEIFNIVPVENLEGGLVAFDIFPNPTTSDNINLSFKGFEGKELLVVLRDISGKEYYSKVEIVSTENDIIAYSPDLTLPKGIYLITASSANELYSQKIIIE